jgi:DNA-directed RNA polymerase specialized sigma24 family protein
MGVSFYDTESSQRRLEALYVLTTAEGVAELLEMWDKVIYMPYNRGDYGVVELLLDFNLAFEEANLTDKQRTAIELVLKQGYTEKEVADVEGVSQSAIAQRIKKGTQRIANVYTQWAERGAY